MYKKPRARSRGTSVFSKIRMALERQVRAKIAAKRNPEQEREAQEWIESILGKKFPPGETFEDVLKDGQVLCHLMNKVSPGSVPKINSSGGQFKMMENINMFQKALKEYGVDDVDVFQTVDLWEKKDIQQVITTLFALGRTTYKHPEWKGPYLGPKPAEECKREFTEEQLRAGEGLIGLQAGSNKGATQSGQSIGATRKILLGKMPRNLWILCVLLSLATLVPALENGLARTPPMGWLAWERFRCNTDCKNDPDNCISDRLFRTMTDIVVAEGYAAVGYEYINVDDCWLEKERDLRGQLVPDRERFPYGMKSLADYVHSKGLKFGIYEDYGNYTCAGYPGILGYLDVDAATFASWDVDYVKLDGCYSHPADMDRGYPEFGFHLNQTGKQMIYSCSWPVYQIYAGMQPNYTAIAEHCNLWRNFDDIQDSWASVESIIDYYGNNQDAIVSIAGPGHWNDPDMLIIGNFGLSYEQSKTQMAIWAILAAPLLMSVDLRTIRPEYKAILQNKKIIAVDQDPLGIQGRRIYKHKGIEIWARPITPIYQNYYSYAIAFVNRRTDGTPSDVSVTLKELGLQYPGGYRVEDLYEDVDYGVLTPQTKIKVKVNPSGVVILRCDLNIEDVYRYSQYSSLNQVYKLRQNSFK